MQQTRRILTARDQLSFAIALLIGTLVGIPFAVIEVTLIAVFFPKLELQLAVFGVAMTCAFLGVGLFLMTVWEPAHTKLPVTKVMWGMGVYWFFLAIWIGLGAGIAVPIRNAPQWLNRYGMGIFFLSILVVPVLSKIIANAWKRRRMAQLPQK